MTVRVDMDRFSFCANLPDRAVWAYRTDAHILEVMTKPGYFARVANELQVGDIVLVDCPGYYQREGILGHKPRQVRRLGGGVLQVEAKAAPNLIGLRIVGRGLRRFVKTGEDAMSEVFEMDMRAPTDDNALSA